MNRNGSRTTAIAAITAAAAEVNALNPHTTITATRVNRIILKAAFLALPECFIPNQVKGSLPRVKG